MTARQFSFLGQVGLDEHGADAGVLDQFAGLLRILPLLR
jgi:hypothetical protein